MNFQEKYTSEHDNEKEKIVISNDIYSLNEVIIQLIENLEKLRRTIVKK